MRTFCLQEEIANDDDDIFHPRDRARGEREQEGDGADA